MQVGSALLCGAMVAPRVGARTAVVTRLAPADNALLDPLRALGVACAATPCAVTALARVVHPSENVDERRLYVLQDPGPFTLADLPRGLRSGIIHLAGISDHEFTVEFIRDLKSAGFALSLDMQSFVRVIGDDRQIIFSDFSAKREVAALLDVVKLDVVEAEILTGTRDLARAAAVFAAWGAREVLITERSGAPCWQQKGGSIMPPSPIAPRWAAPGAATPPSVPTSPAASRIPLRTRCASPPRWCR